MELGILDAATFLGTVVVKQLEDMLAQENQGNEVAQGQQGHEQVTQVPDELKTGHRAKEDEHAAREYAEHLNCPFFVGQETNVGLTIIVIADDAAEGKQDNRDGHKDGANCPPDSPSRLA